MTERVKKTTIKKRKMPKQEIAETLCVNSFSIANTTEKKNCIRKKKKCIVTGNEKPSEDDSKKDISNTDANGESISEAGPINNETESDFDYEEVDTWCNDLDEEASKKFALVTSQLESILKKMQYTSDEPSKSMKKRAKKPAAGVVENKSNAETSSHKISRQEIPFRQPTGDLIKLDKKKRTSAKHIHFD